ncbi:hypothetical protein niasHS_011955 [Heterodera schachtii]|uniref:RNA helicase n=1 Tax=Heterodera schachtii TaxID=97005 RepID=A0ABD2I8E4_HETSC
MDYPSGIEPMIRNGTNPYTGNPFRDKYWKHYAKRTRLPIWKRKNEFFDAMDQHKCILLEAETGSGKTTQVPQWCVEWWKTRHPHTRNLVCCTQPRRLATVSVAQRVAIEMDVELGSIVGYSIRFEDVSNHDTLLKYCTDGVLLAESSRDEMLSMYGVILLDEVHERTMITDVVMGLVKRIMRYRPELRVVVMSASLQTGTFVQYFSEFDYLTMKISGRTFPVEIKHSDWDLTFEPNEYISKAVEKAIAIHRREAHGDILLFLCGQDEIERACEMLEEEAKKCRESGQLDVLPLYGSMQLEQQRKLLEAEQNHLTNAITRYRRCIVATNVAETSMTIDGVVYVIDPGFCKRNIYNPNSKIESLLVQHISRASAVQRAGRAGRTRPGKCFRLYTEHCYEKIMKEIMPEIKHSNLDSVVLRLKKIGINDIYNFDLIDAPPLEQIQSAIRMLKDIGALDVSDEVTALGEQINSLPVDPPLARMMLESVKLHCSEEVISICAMLSAPNSCFLRPRKKQIQADQAKANFIDDAGDHLTLLRVFNAFSATNDSSKEEWCYANFLNFRTLQYAGDVRNQLANAMIQRLNIQLESLKPTSPLYPHNILKALLAASFMKLAYFHSSGIGHTPQARKGYYVTVESQLNRNGKQNAVTDQYMLHGSSVLYKGNKQYSNQKPAWVLFNEAVQRDHSDRRFLQTVSIVRPEWLAELAPHYRIKILVSAPEVDKLIKKAAITESYGGENEINEQIERYFGRNLLD